MTTAKATNNDVIEYYDRECTRMREIILSRIEEIKFDLTMAAHRIKTRDGIPSQDGIIGAAGASLDRDCARYAQLRLVVETFRGVNEEAHIDQA